MPAMAPTSYADRKGVAGWILFDAAAQPWFTLVTTFVFGPFFAASLAATPAEGQALWGFATGLAGLTIAFGAPVLGSIADASGGRKPWIGAFGLLMAMCALLLWFAAPGAEYAVPLALVAFTLGTIGAEFAGVFNNAMMPTLVPKERLGRLSGYGWAAGYASGLVGLVIVLGFLAGSPETGRTLIGMEPLFGLDPMTREGDRIVGPFTAIWFALLVLPLFLFTPDAPRGMPMRDAVGAGLSSLKQSLRDLWPNRPARLFLIAHMIYADGLAALFAFAGIYGAGVLGWSIIEVGLFGVFLTVTGTFGALIGGRADDRFGSKPVVLVALTVLTLASLAILSLGPSHVFFVVETAPGSDGLFSSLPEQLFLAIGGVMGAAVGPMQASSRTLLARLAPPDSQAQFFGLFALSGKVTSFVGPWAVATLTAITMDQRAGISVLVLFFVFGAFLLFKVDSPDER